MATPETNSDDDGGGSDTTLIVVIVVVVAVVLVVSGVVGAVILYRRRSIPQKGGMFSLDDHFEQNEMMLPLDRQAYDSDPSKGDMEEREEVTL